ncbi:hypothetical protein NVP1063O_165 [Vibrio phage 1.063.O._10N.261.45.C7]|nr:hypothetical protein NVP1063O_165 [Vibrio phage 1.063.O._10N.261.45.C7]
MGTLQYLGEAWEFCRFDWGLDDCITIDSSHGKLILVYQYRNLTTGNIVSKSVSAASRKGYRGDTV